MEKRIIFFDIDGTLSNEEDGYIPNSTIKAIQNAQANGHICIINTGRPVSTIDQDIKNIGFDGYICGCGTYIEYHNKVLFHLELPQQIRKDIIDMTIKCRIDNVLEGIQGAFFPETSIHPFVKKVEKDYLKLNHPVLYYNQESDVMFDKFAAWYHEGSDIDTFKAFLEPNFHVIQRDVDFIEVVPKQVSKATGIQMIIDYLNMSIDQTISIGDSTNDLPMLTYTKESIAMGNSNPILFDVVTYRTDSILNNGIEKALKHFRII